MYFRRFPTVLYNFDIQPTGDPTLKLITDITTNVRLRKVILENITLFDEYDIIDGETPEIIADKIYGSAEYHWIILLCNQRYDYIEDFPLSSQALVEYVKEKYNDPDGVHHFEDNNGLLRNGFSHSGTYRIQSTSISESTRIFDSPVTTTPSSPKLIETVNIEEDLSVTKNNVPIYYSNSLNQPFVQPQHTQLTRMERRVTTLTNKIEITTNTPHNFNPLFFNDTLMFLRESSESFVEQMKVVLIPSPTQLIVEQQINSKSLNLLSSGRCVIREFPKNNVVTNFMYEEQLNEKKRRIKLISPQLLGRILSEFKDLI